MSFRTVVTLLFVIASVLIVVPAGAALNQLSQNEIKNRLDSRISKQIESVSNSDILPQILHLRRFLYQNTGTEPATEVQAFFDVQLPTRIYVNKELFLATEGFPQISEQSLLTDQFSTIDLNGEQCRGLNKEFFTRSRVNPPGRLGIVGQEFLITIEVIGSYDVVDSTLTDVRNSFVSVGIVVVILLGVIGWVLGWIIVKPLGRLSKDAMMINDSSDLSERVNSESKYSFSEVQNLTASINEMLRRLEQSNKVTQEALVSSRSFASNVAHELRTPLTSMKMNLDLLGRNLEIDNSQKSEIISDLISQQDNLISILESLRLLSRGDLSEENIFEEIDFIQFINELTIKHERQYPESKFNLILTSEFPLVYAWREGLQVMFSNLIVNSVTHSKMYPEQLVIEISTEISDNNLILTIDDNGIGIPENERTLVLERFQKGHSSSINGSGLGLALVKQQVEIHNGFLENTSNPSSGARFVISLPIVI
ncbi:MAG: HAMP domain-containing histidine kinase [SAR202 cluster bacterium]|nr:HAMP domain-containing histidine kinase [SAR202 cluster bacterium]